jgi:aryl sulfotransferase
MQHLAFQVLLRGRGDLPGEGIALNAIAPWLESTRTVDVHSAPLLGTERPSRLIKTHLPASLCPFSLDAKYIYVARHPVSCFASCVDYVRSNLRGFSPKLGEFERWYRSNDLMWWGTWPMHIAGWWRRAEREPNVVLIRFEDMKRDLPAVAVRVAEFLEVPCLTENELAEIVEKCSFTYMRQHADAFEMHPPQLLQAAGSFFVSGKMDRLADVPLTVRRRIADWCHAECVARATPIQDLYPDLACEAHGSRHALRP